MLEEGTGKHGNIEPVAVFEFEIQRGERDNSSSCRKLQFIGIPSILRACSVPISNQRHPTVPFDPHRMASATGLARCSSSSTWCILRIGRWGCVVGGRVNKRPLIINTKQAGGRAGSLCQFLPRSDTFIGSRVAERCSPRSTTSSQPASQYPSSSYATSIPRPCPNIPFDPS